MPITDADGKTLVTVNLALTDDEAQELRDALGDLLTTRQPGWHAHVSDADYQREVTVYRADDTTLA
jgi:hypothetical protein